MIILDSFAWFEYFLGSKAGGRVDEILREGGDVGTPSTCLTEIIRKRRRESRPWKREADFIQSASKILPITQSIALRAGEEDRLHFADALIYATAVEHNAVLVTGDAHFKGLSGVELF